MWKDPKKAVDNKTPKIKAARIRITEKGRTTPELQRKKWGKFIAKEECSFSVLGRERSANFECFTVRSFSVPFLHEQRSHRKWNAISG